MGGKNMRNKIYSERRRKLHSFFNQVLKNSFIAKLIHKNQKTNDLEIDQLTGIYNKFAINHYLKELHPSSDLSFGIILLSIDNFTEIKEKFNQKIFDKTISSVAQALMNNIRDTDIVGRYSESEFILILSDVNKEQASHVATRLSNLINNNALTIHGKSVAPHASSGVSVSEQNTMSNIVLEQADQALYLAKHQPNNFYNSTSVLT